MGEVSFVIYNGEIILPEAEKSNMIMDTENCGNVNLSL